jgi:hypothetical protein
MFKLISFLSNMEGAVGGVPLKYGAVRGAINATSDTPMAASVVVSGTSGRFVTIDSSGNAIITVASSTTLYGFIEAAAQTCSATAAATVLPAIVDCNTIFRIPVFNAGGTAGGSLANWKAIIGKKLDLKVDTGIQYLDADVTTRGHVIVVGADAFANGCRWVDVKINQAIQGK